MSDPFGLLETDRLFLRPISSDDLDFVFRHFSDAEVGKYLVDDDPVTTLSQAQAIVEFYVESSSRSFNRWILVRKLDNQPIGTCGFHKWNQRHHTAEIGYDLSRLAWGQGYMSEALRCMIEFGFGVLRLNRIEAVVHPANEASLRLLERHRFRREGLMREVLCQDGIYYDHWLLSLLSKDWRSAVLEDH